MTCQFAQGAIAMFHSYPYDERRFHISMERGVCLQDEGEAPFLFLDVTTQLLDGTDGEPYYVTFHVGSDDIHVPPSRPGEGTCMSPALLTLLMEEMGAVLRLEKQMEEDPELIPLVLELMDIGASDGEEEGGEARPFKPHPDDLFEWTCGTRATRAEIDRGDYYFMTDDYVAVPEGDF